MPPLYILSSKAANEDNYKYDPSVCEGLPIVTAKYANDGYKTYPSRVAVRSKGSMELNLWEQLITDVYLPCYRGKISPTPIRDPVTNKLISGPAIMKTDAGPARLASDAKSVEFREYLASMGFHIMLSLPNGTECTAELDQIFSSYKPACKESTRRVAGMKMWLRVQARNKATANANPIELTHAEQLAGYVAVNDSDDENEDGDDDYTFNVGSSVCNVSIDNRDLGAIVNGMPGDEIDKRPFDNTFTRPKIIDTCIKVGFLPMTGNAVNDPKVRYELGEGGAPPEASSRMELLEEEYNECAETLLRLGYNGKVLDLRARRVAAMEEGLPDDEEAQVQHILDKNMITKSGGLFKTGIIVSNSRVVLEAAKRKKAMEEEKKKKKAEKDRNKEDKDTYAAASYFAKWTRDGEKVDADGKPKLGKDAAIAIVKVLLPRINPNLKMKDYGTMKKCNDWLASLADWKAEMQKFEEEHTTANSRQALFSVPNTSAIQLSDN